MTTVILVVVAAFCHAGFYLSLLSWSIKLEHQRVEQERRDTLASHDAKGVTEP